MIYSMTGFGRSELSEGGKKYTVELKSVNHKYIDINIRLPRNFNAFEPEIRKLLKEYASRGKIDIFISYEDLTGATQNLKYNESLAAEYFKYYKQIREMMGAEDEIRTSHIARCPEVLTLEEEDANDEETWEGLKKTLTEAFDSFRASRGREGDALKENILLKLDEMDSHASFLEERMPDIINDYKEKLTARVAELLEPGLIDDSRIAAEVTLYADKVAIDEELVRLKTHISNMRALLLKGGEIGRNLDFIAQEMNRESNTILSKANDMEISERGILLKTCIEKIREQVQNIE